MTFLFAWGANSYGQLGVGDDVDRVLPVEVPIASSLPAAACPPRVDWIAAGGGHTIVSVDCGTHVLACGLNDKGQLGIGQEDKQLTSFCRLSLPSDVKLIAAACGWDFTLGISASGQLWAWGSNAFGQLGLGQEACKLQRTPTRVQLVDDETSSSPVRVAQVATGLRHSVVLTDGGKVYTCGANRKGQLGSMHSHHNNGCNSKSCSFGSSGSSGDQCRSNGHFEKVILPVDAGRITNVAAGSRHTIAVTEHGQILVWGSTEHGLIPKSGILSPISEPYLFSVSSRIVTCASGWSHVAALTVDGQIFTWGRGDYGQLGRVVQQEARGKEAGFELTALPIQNANKVVCGAEHTLVISDNGRKLFGFGFNEHGMCGTGDTENQHTPYLVDFFERADMLVSCISSGSGHVFAVAATKPRC